MMMWKAMMTSLEAEIGLDQATFEGAIGGWKGDGTRCFDCCE